MAWNRLLNEIDHCGTYDLIDSETPKHHILSARYKKSFAYYTMRHRLPVILTQIINQLNKDKDVLSYLYNGDETREEIKLIVGEISKLKYKLQTDKKFEEFSSEEPDKELWNNFIQQHPSDSCSSFHSCWLYAECYMYRKVSSFFENSKTLRNFDYFAKEKQNGLQIPGIEGVAYAVKNIEKGFKTFDQLVKLSLWGNKCDLSIVLPKEFQPDENVFEQLDSFNSNILINNNQKIWQCLESADDSKPIIVEFVNDNAGFELYTDFILADYLIDNKLASKVRFSAKPIPWFVSDVITSDIAWSLDYLSKHEAPPVRYLASKWKQYFEEEKFVISPAHHFWVSAYEFYKMSEISPDLYQYLAEAHLVIFKGDLNYRKLLGDINWDHTEEFVKCIKGFRPTNFCSLRTLKSDLVCGLPIGKSEELQSLDSKWMCTGEYGVIQFMEKWNDDKDNN